MALNNPTPLPVGPPLVPPTPSQQVSKDLLDMLKKQGAAYIVDDGDNISITWLSCNKTNSPDINPAILLGVTSSKRETPTPVTIHEKFLTADHIMLYDEDTSKSLSWFINPKNEEMRYNS